MVTRTELRLRALGVHPLFLQAVYPVLARLALHTRGLANVDRQLRVEVQTQRLDLFATEAVAKAVEASTVVVFALFLLVCCRHLQHSTSISLGSLSAVAEGRSHLRHDGLGHSSADGAVDEVLALDLAATQCGFVLRQHFALHLSL